MHLIVMGNSFPAQAIHAHQVIFGVATFVSFYLFLVQPNYIVKPEPGFFTQNLPKKMWLVTLTKIFFRELPKINI